MLSPLGSVRAYVFVSLFNSWRAQGGCRFGWRCQTSKRRNSSGVPLRCCIGSSRFLLDVFGFIKTDAAWTSCRHCLLFFSPFSLIFGHRRRDRQIPSGWWPNGLNRRPRLSHLFSIDFSLRSALPTEPRFCLWVLVFVCLFLCFSSFRSLHCLLFFSPSDNSWPWTRDRRPTWDSEKLYLTSPPCPSVHCPPSWPFLPPSFCPFTPLFWTSKASRSRWQTGAQA